ncbi:MAG: hypothetical protein IKR81_12370, partial [Victivallales bacterium]|nr:hypothetical protein [Victivallales bacterium]
QRRPDLNAGGVRGWRRVFGGRWHSQEATGNARKNNGLGCKIRFFYYSMNRYSQKRLYQKQKLLKKCPKNVLKEYFMHKNTLSDTILKYKALIFAFFWHSGFFSAF